MKNELNPTVLAVIGGIAVIAILVLGFGWFNRTVNPGEDPELARQQWEVEAARTPGGGPPMGAPAAVPQDPSTGATFSPGRESEMSARGAQSGQ